MEALITTLGKVVDFYLATPLPKATLNSLVDIWQAASAALITLAREYIIVFFG